MDASQASETGSIPVTRSTPQSPPDEVGPPFAKASTYVNTSVDTSGGAPRVKKSEAKKHEEKEKPAWRLAF